MSTTDSSSNPILRRLGVVSNDAGHYSKIGFDAELPIDDWCYTPYFKRASDAALAGLPPEAEGKEEAAPGGLLAALAREDREADQQADLAAFLGSSHRHGSHHADSFPPC